MNYTIRAQQLVTPDILAEYEQNGAVCIRNMLNEDELETVRSGIDENLRNPSIHFKVASKPDDSGKFVEDFCTWQDNKFYKEFIYQSPCASVAGLLMKSSTSRFYHDHLLVKEANTEQITPWHQDQPYYDIDGMQNCSFWIAIDPVPRSSTLEFIAGSHRSGQWYMPRTFMDHDAKWFPEGSLEEIPDIESNRNAFPIIGWPVEPGDVVAFHMLTIHGSRGTVGIDHRRRVFSLRFLGDDIRHSPRTWHTSPDLSHITKSIRAGSPMSHPSFPLIWTKII